MALVGLDGRWLRVNDAVCRIVGYTEKELLAINFQEITHPDDLNADMALVERLLAGEIHEYELEKRYFHKEGHIVWIQLSASLARDEDGRPEVFVSQLQDITARKEAEQALAKSLREKEHLLAKLQSAYDDTRRLRESILTMCAWTKRVHHDGRWISIDEFLCKHLRLQLTHGISEEAVAGVLAEFHEAERHRRVG